MPLEIRGSFTISRPDPGGEIQSDRHLWLDKTKRIVVEDGDDRAAHLLVATNGTIPAREAERLGLKLVSGRLMQPDAVNVVHAQPRPQEVERQREISLQAATITEKRDARRKRRKPAAVKVTAKSAAKKQAKK